MVAGPEAALPHLSEHPAATVSVHAESAVPAGIRANEGGIAPARATAMVPMAGGSCRRPPPPTCARRP